MMNVYFIKNKFCENRAYFAVHYPFDKTYMINT